MKIAASCVRRMRDDTHFLLTFFHFFAIRLYAVADRVNIRKTKGYETPYALQKGILPHESRCARSVFGLSFLMDMGSLSTCDHDHETRGRKLVGTVEHQF